MQIGYTLTHRFLHRAAAILICNLYRCPDSMTMESLHGDLDRVGHFSRSLE